MPPYPKEVKYRDPDLLRAAALMPCVNCGRERPVQAAHVGGLEDGKGRGLKVSDSHVAALCTIHDSDGGRLVNGCHERFDQNRLGPGCNSVFIARTLIALIECGLLKVDRKLLKEMSAERSSM